MSILLVSGSARSASSNRQLMAAVAAGFPDYDFTPFNGLIDLPLFRPEMDHAPWPTEVTEWRNSLQVASAVIFSTPEYLRNLPAVLKNALEWVSTSGELAGKPVLAITFTPHAPRGERARQSLTWSLGALDARIVAELPLYQNEMTSENGHLILSPDSKEMFAEALKLLIS